MKKEEENLFNYRIKYGKFIGKLKAAEKGNKTMRTLKKLSWQID